MRREQKELPDEAFRNECLQQSGKRKKRKFGALSDNPEYCEEIDEEVSQFRQQNKASNVFKAIIEIQDLKKWKTMR